MNDLNRLTLELQVVNSAIDHTHWNESFKEGKTLTLSEFSIIKSINQSPVKHRR